jgi:hypothetical protein
MLMGTFHTLRATRLVSGLAVLGLSVSVIMIGATPVHAVDCNDVRALSQVEQNYWAKRLQLTPGQRHRIWLACYGRPGTRETKADHLEAVIGQH